MNTEFKKISASNNQTVYVLEDASSGGPSAGSIATVSKPLGGVRKRGQNLIAQEGNKDKVDANKPRNFVAKNAKMGGAGAHKDQKKAAKQGDVKHKNKEMDMAEGERRMSRAAKGYEKYGKKGMMALAKAGREGASDEKLDKIRDKHDHYNEGVAEGYDEWAAGIDKRKAAMDAQYGEHTPPSKTLAKLMRIPGFKKVSPAEQHRVAKAVDGYLARDMSFDQALVLAQKQGVAEAGDTAKGQKMLAKVHNRAADRVTSKQADKDPAYARKAQQTQDRAWDRLAVKEQGVAEEWSQKYKSSINCSHPKGFSQKAHCAGKKKHTESMMTMEAVCPDCGMCQTHGNLNEIKKGAKDSNGFTKCWPGHHAAGTKKGKNGGQVRNCVPNEGVAEDHSTATGGWGQGAYATASASSKWAGPGQDDSVQENPDWYNDEANGMTTSQLKSLIKHAARLRHAVKAMQAQGDTLEPWQQAKVTKAADYLDAVFTAVDDDHDMGEDSYMAELQAKLDEKIPKNAPVDVWIKDFEKSNAPQFKGKTKEKRRQMAVAASYGAKTPSKKR